jgi:V/A-type H+-transporting ATPase subunit F
MYKIAVMGDMDSVLGFKALGLEVCPVDTPEAGREALHKMAKENYAIIYMTEQLAVQMQPEIARYKDALTPAIILIPGKEGSLGVGMGTSRPQWNGRSARTFCKGVICEERRFSLWERSSRSPARWWWQLAWRRPTWPTWSV